MSLSVLAYQEVTRRIDELTRAIYGLDPYFVMPVATPSDEAARTLAALVATADSARARRARSPDRRARARALAVPEPPRGRSPAWVLGGTTYAEIVRGQGSRSSSISSQRHPSTQSHYEILNVEQSRIGSSASHGDYSEISAPCEHTEYDSARSSETRVFESESEPVRVEICQDEFVPYTEGDFHGTKPMDYKIQEPVHVTRVVETVEDLPVTSLEIVQPDYQEKDRSPDCRSRSQDLSYAEILALGLRRQPKTQTIVSLPKPQVAQVDMTIEEIKEMETQIIKKDRTDHLKVKPEKPERSQRSRSRDMPRQRRAPEKRQAKSHEAQAQKKKKSSKKVLEVDDFDDVDDEDMATSAEIKVEKPETLRKEVTKKVQHSSTVVETVTEIVSTEAVQEDSLDVEHKQTKKKKLKKHKVNEDEIEKALKEIESLDKHKKKKIKDSHEKTEPEFENQLNKGKTIEIQLLPQEGAEKSKSKKNKHRVMVTDFITIESEIKEPETTEPKPVIQHKKITENLGKSQIVCNALDDASQQMMTESENKRSKNKKKKPKQENHDIQSQLVRNDSQSEDNKNITGLVSQDVQFDTGNSNESVFNVNEPTKKLSKISSNMEITTETATTCEFVDSAELKDKDVEYSSFDKTEGDKSETTKTNVANVGIPKEKSKKKKEKKGKTQYQGLNFIETKSDVETLVETSIQDNSQKVSNIPTQKDDQSQIQALEIQQINKEKGKKEVVSLNRESLETVVKEPTHIQQDDLEPNTTLTKSSKGKSKSKETKQFGNDAGETDQYMEKRTSPDKNISSDNKGKSKSKISKQETSLTETKFVIEKEDLPIEETAEAQFKVVKSHKKKPKSKKPKVVDDEIERALKEIDESQVPKKKEKHAEKIPKKNQRSECLTESCKTECKLDSIHEVSEVKENLITMDWNTLMAEEKSVPLDISKQPEILDTTQQVATEVTILESNALLKEDYTNVCRDNIPDVCSESTSIGTKLSKDSDNTKVDIKNKQQEISPSPASEQNNNDKNFNTESLKDTVIIEETTIEPVIEDLKTRTIYLITHEEKKLPPIRTVKVFSSKSNSLEESENIEESIADVVTNTTSIELTSSCDNTTTEEKTANKEQLEEQDVHRVTQNRTEPATVEKTDMHTIPKEIDNTFVKTFAETDSSVFDNSNKSLNILKDNVQKLDLEETDQSLSREHGLEANNMSTTDVTTVSEYQTNIECAETNITEYKEIHKAETIETGHEITVSEVSVEDQNTNEVEEAIFGSVKDRNKKVKKESQNSSIPYEELEEIKTYSLELDFDQIDYNYYQYVLKTRDSSEKLAEVNIVTSPEVIKDVAHEGSRKLSETTDIYSKDLPGALLMEEVPKYSYYEINAAEALLASLPTETTLQTVQSKEKKSAIQPENNVLRMNTLEYLRHEVHLQSYHELVDAETIYAMTKDSRQSPAKQVTFEELSHVESFKKFQLPEAQSANAPNKEEAKELPNSDKLKQNYHDIKDAEYLLAITKTVEDKRQVVPSHVESTIIHEKTKSSTSKEELTATSSGVDKSIDATLSETSSDHIQTVLVTNGLKEGATVTNSQINVNKLRIHELPRFNYQDICDAEQLYATVTTNRCHEEITEPDLIQSQEHISVKIQPDETSPKTKQKEIKADQNINEVTNLIDDAIENSAKVTEHRPAGSLGLVLESLRYSYHEIQDAEQKLAVINSDKENKTLAQSMEDDSSMPSIQAEKINKPDLFESESNVAEPQSSTSTKSDPTESSISNKGIPTDYEEKEYVIPEKELRNTLVSMIFKDKAFIENSIKASEALKIDDNEKSLPSNEGISHIIAERDSGVTISTNTIEKDECRVADEIIDDESDFVIIGTKDLIQEKSLDSNINIIHTIEEPEHTGLCQDLDEKPLLEHITPVIDGGNLDQESTPASTLHDSREFIQRELQSAFDVVTEKCTKADTQSVTDENVLKSKELETSIQLGLNIVSTKGNDIKAEDFVNVTQSETANEQIVLPCPDSVIRTEVKSPIHSLKDLLPSIDSIPEFKPSYPVVFSNLSADAPEFTPSYMYKSVESSSEMKVPFDDHQKQFPELHGTKDISFTTEIDTEVKTSYSTILQTKKEKESPPRRDISDLADKPPTETPNETDKIKEEGTQGTSKRQKKKKKKEDKRENVVEQPTHSTEVTAAEPKTNAIEPINVWAKCNEDGKSYAEVVAEGLHENIDISLSKQEAQLIYDSNTKYDVKSGPQEEIEITQEPQNIDSNENSWAKIVAIHHTSPDRAEEVPRKETSKEIHIHRPPLILVDESSSENKSEVLVDTEGFIVVEKRSRSRSRSRDNRSRSKSNVTHSNEKRETSENRFQALPIPKPIESEVSSPNEEENAIVERDEENKTLTKIEKPKKNRCRSGKSKEKDINVPELPETILTHKEEELPKKDKKKKTNKSKETVKSDEITKPKEEVNVTLVEGKNKTEVKSSQLEEFEEKKKNKKKKKDKRSSPLTESITPLEELKVDENPKQDEDKLVTQTSVSSPESIHTPIKERFYNEAQYWKIDPSGIEEVLTVELSPAKEIMTITTETKSETDNTLKYNTEHTLISTEINRSEVKLTEELSLESKMADLQREIEEMLEPEDSSLVSDDTPKELMSSASSVSHNDVIDNITPLLASPESETEIAITEDYSPTTDKGTKSKEVTTGDKHISVSMIDALLEDEPAVIEHPQEEMKTICSTFIEHINKKEKVGEEKLENKTVEQTVQDVNVNNSVSADISEKPLDVDNSRTITDLSNTAHEVITNLSNIKVDNFWVDKSAIDDAEHLLVKRKQIVTPETVSLDNIRRDSLEENILIDNSFWIEKPMYHDAECQYFLSIAKKTKTPPISKVEIQANDQNDKDKDPSGSSGHTSDADETKDPCGSPFDSNYISMDLPGGICSWKDQSSYLSVETPTDSLISDDRIGDIREDILTALPLEPVPLLPSQEPAAEATRRIPKDDLSNDIESLLEEVKNVQARLSDLPDESLGAMEEGLREGISILNKCDEAAELLESKMMEYRQEAEIQNLSREVVVIRARISKLLLQARQGLDIIKDAKVEVARQAKDMEDQKLKIAQLDKWLESIDYELKESTKQSEILTEEDIIRYIEIYEKYIREYEEYEVILKSITNVDKSSQSLNEKLKATQQSLVETKNLVIVEIERLRQVLLQMRSVAEVIEEDISQTDRTIDSTSMPEEIVSPREADIVKQEDLTVKEISSEKESIVSKEKPEDKICSEKRSSETKTNTKKSTKKGDQDKIVVTEEKPTYTIETQTGQSLRSESPHVTDKSVMCEPEKKTTQDASITCAPPMDVEIQTSEPISDNREILENIQVRQTVTGGHEIFEIATRPIARNQQIDEQSLLVDANYKDDSQGKDSRLNITHSLPQSFETVMVEPDETTTEVVVDADGTKRIIVKKVRKTLVTRQQLVHSHRETTQMISDGTQEQSFSQIILKEDKGSSSTMLGDGGVQRVEYQTFGGQVVSGLPGGEVTIQEFSSRPGVVVKLEEGLNPEEILQLAETEGQQQIQTSSSSVTAVVQQVTKRIVKTKRRIIRRVVIIDGKEHVTEEVIEEPDNIEVYEEQIPRVSISVKDQGGVQFEEINDDDDDHRDDEGPLPDMSQYPKSTGETTHKVGDKPDDKRQDKPDAGNKPLKADSPETKQGIDIRELSSDFIQKESQSQSQHTESRSISKHSEMKETSPVQTILTTHENVPKETRQDQELLCHTQEPNQTPATHVGEISAAKSDDCISIYQPKDKSPDDNKSHKGEDHKSKEDVSELSKDFIQMESQRCSQYAESSTTTKQSQIRETSPVETVIISETQENIPEVEEVQESYHVQEPQDLQSTFVSEGYQQSTLQTASSNISTVVQKVTRKITRTRRRIIKHIQIIDGKEHVTEEIIDEPDDVEIIEEEPKVSTHTIQEKGVKTKRIKIIRQVQIIDGKEHVSEQIVEEPDDEFIPETTVSTEIDVNIDKKPGFVTKESVEIHAQGLLTPATTELHASLVDVTNNSITSDQTKEVDSSKAIGNDPVDVKDQVKEVANIEPIADQAKETTKELSSPLPSPSRKSKSASPSKRVTFVDKLIEKSKTEETTKDQEIKRDTLEKSLQPTRIVSDSTSDMQITESETASSFIERNQPPVDIPSLHEKRVESPKTHQKPNTETDISIPAPDTEIIVHGQKTESIISNIDSKVGVTVDFITNEKAHALHPETNQDTEKITSVTSEISSVSVKTDSSHKIETRNTSEIQSTIEPSLKPQETDKSKPDTGVPVSPKQSAKEDDIIHSSPVDKEKDKLRTLEITAISSSRTEDVASVEGNVSESLKLDMTIVERSVVHDRIDSQAVDDAEKPPTPEKQQRDETDISTESPSDIIDVTDNIRNTEVQVPKKRGKKAKNKGWSVEKQSVEDKLQEPVLSVTEPKLDEIESNIVAAKDSLAQSHKKDVDVKLSAEQHKDLDTKYDINLLLDAERADSHLRQRPTPVVQAKPLQTVDITMSISKTDVAKKDDPKVHLDMKVENFETEQSTIVKKDIDVNLPSEVKIVEDHPQTGPKTPEISAEIKVEETIQTSSGTPDPSKDHRKSKKKKKHKPTPDASLEESTKSEFPVEIPEDKSVMDTDSSSLSHYIELPTSPTLDSPKPTEDILEPKVESLEPDSFAESERTAEEKGYEAEEMSQGPTPVPKKRQKKRKAHGASQDTTYPKETTAESDDTSLSSPIEIAEPVQEKKGKKKKGKKEPPADPEEVEGAESVQPVEHTPQSPKTGNENIASPNEESYHTMSEISDISTVKIIEECVQSSPESLHKEVTTTVTYPVPVIEEIPTQEYSVQTSPELSESIKDDKEELKPETVAIELQTSPTSVIETVVQTSPRDEKDIDTQTIENIITVAEKVPVMDTEIQTSRTETPQKMDQIEVTTQVIAHDIVTPEEKYSQTSSPIELTPVKLETAEVVTESKEIQTSPTPTIQKYEKSTGVSIETVETDIQTSQDIIDQETCTTPVPEKEVIEMSIQTPELPVVSASTQSDYVEPERKVTTEVSSPAPPKPEVFDASQQTSPRTPEEPVIGTTVEKEPETVSILPIEKEVTTVDSTQQTTPRDTALDVPRTRPVDSELSKIKAVTIDSTQQTSPRVYSEDSLSTSTEEPYEIHLRAQITIPEATNDFLDNERQMEAPLGNERQMEAPQSILGDRQKPRKRKNKRKMESPIAQTPESLSDPITTELLMSATPTSEDYTSKDTSSIDEGISQLASPMSPDHQEFGNQHKLTYSDVVQRSKSKSPSPTKSIHFPRKPEKARLLDALEKRTQALIESPRKVPDDSMAIVVLDQSVEKSYDSVVNKELQDLKNAIDTNDQTRIERSVVVIIETISVWLEEIQYKIQTETITNGESVNEAQRLKSLQGYIQNLKEIIEITEVNEEIVTLIEMLTRQANAVNDLNCQSSTTVKEVEKDWVKFLDDTDKLYQSVNKVKSKLDDIILSDIPTQQKLDKLDKLENENVTNSDSVTKMFRRYRLLVENNIKRECPTTLYACDDDTKQVENSINTERDRLLQLSALAEEYEQTLQDFGQITDVAEALLDGKIIVSDLDHLHEEIQKHRKFFVNLSHCRAILESLEDNLDGETRSKYSSLHNSLHDRATVIIDRAAGRAQQMTLAASRWTTLEQGMREEQQWLRVAHQRIPDLTNVTSIDHEQYINLYQSVSLDVSHHHAKILRLLSVTDGLQNLIVCSGLETECSIALDTLLKLQEDVDSRLIRLTAFKENWMTYDFIVERIENWMKIAHMELEHITPENITTTGNLRRFWELKAQHEVHNNLKNESGVQFEKALEILPISDEMVQRQFFSKIEDEWREIAVRIDGLHSSAIQSISDRDVSTSEKLNILEDEIRELRASLDSLKTVIRSEDELNLYIERLQVMTGRVDRIQNELSRLSLLPTAESDRLGALLSQSRNLDDQIAEELERSMLLKEKIVQVQAGITRCQKNQRRGRLTLEECAAAERLGSDVVERASETCDRLLDDLSTQWRDIRALNQALHTLPTCLRVSVSLTDLERDITGLQESHAQLETEASELSARLRAKVQLWRRFERQLELVQGAVREADYMAELLTVQGQVDYDRLLKATEKLETLSESLTRRSGELVGELRASAAPLAASTEPAVAAKMQRELDDAAAAYDHTCRNLTQLCDKYHKAVELWKRYRDAAAAVRVFAEQQEGRLHALRPAEAPTVAQACLEQESRVAELRSLAARVATETGSRALQADADALARRLQLVAGAVQALADLGEARQLARAKAQHVTEQFSDMRQDLMPLHEDGEIVEDQLIALRENLITLGKSEADIVPAKEQLPDIDRDVSEEHSIVRILELWQAMFRDTFLHYHRLSTALVRSGDAATALRLWHEYLQDLQSFLSGSVPADYENLTEHRRLCRVHRNLLASQRSVLINEHKETKHRDLAEKFDTLTNLHNETLARIVERHDEVSTRIAAWDDYREIYIEVLRWLKEMEREKEKLQLRYVHIKRIQKILTKVQNLSDKIPEGRKQAEKLSSNLKKILEFTEETYGASVRMEYAGIVKRVDNLNASLDTWRDFLTRILGLVSEYENLTNDLHKLYSKTQDEIISYSDEDRLSRPQLKKAIEKYTELRTKVDKTESQIEALSVIQEQLKECLSPQDIRIVNQRVWQLRQQRADLEHQLTIIIHRLQERLEIYTILNSRLLRFAEWLTTLEARLETSSQNSDLGALDPQDLIRRITSDVEAETSMKEREFEWLSETGSVLVDLSKKDEKAFSKTTNKQLSEINARWHKLQDSGRARISKISELLETITQLEERLTTIRLKLHTIETNLTTTVIIQVLTTKTVDEKFQERDEIHKNIETVSGEVGETLNLCELIFNDPDVLRGNFDLRNLRTGVDIVEKKWKNICDMSERRKNTLKEIRKSAELANSLLAKVEKKLDSLEKRVEKIETRKQRGEGDDESVSKAVIRDLEAMEEDVKRLEDAYSRVASARGVELRGDAADLAARLRSAVRRWQQLRGRVDAAGADAHRQFVAAHGSAVIALAEADVRLTRALHLAPTPLDKDATMAELMGVERELAECAALVQTADQLAGNVSSVAGVSDMVAEYHALYSDVRQRLAAARADLVGDVDSAVQVDTLKWETDAALQVDTLTSKETYRAELASAVKEASDCLEALRTALLQQPKEDAGSDELATAAKEIAKAGAKPSQILELAKHLSELLLTECDATEDEAMLKEVESLSLRYEDLLAQAKKRELQINNLRLPHSASYALTCEHETGRLTCPLCSERNWKQLDNDLWRLEQWLQFAEATEEGRGDPPEQYDQLEDAIQDHREFLLDLDSHKSIVVSLNVVGAHVAAHASVAADAQRVRARLAAANARWDQACARAGVWQKRLQRALVHNQQFHDIVVELVARLAAAERGVRAREPLRLSRPAAELQRDFRRFSELRDELSRAEPRVHALHDAAQLLRSGDAPPNADDICRRLGELRLRLQSLRKLSGVYALKLGAALARQPRGTSALAAAVAASAPMLMEEEEEQISTLELPPLDENDVVVTEDDEELSRLQRSLRFVCRVARASLPFQALLLLLLGAAALAPHASSDCRAPGLALEPVLRYPDGPPPL